MKMIYFQASERKANLFAFPSERRKHRVKTLYFQASERKANLFAFPSERRKHRVKALYIANARIPTEKAHGLQIMQMCQAFSMAGLEVELLLPWRFNTIKEGAFKYYGIKNIFKIKKLFSIDLIDFPFIRSFGRFGLWIQSFSFSSMVFFYLLFKKVDFIYSRDLFSLFLLGSDPREGLTLMYEAHSFPSHFSLYKRVFQKIKAIIVITQKLKELFIQQGIPSNKILVAPDGVDLNYFQIPESQKECRQKLNLPQDKKIVLYTGHLYKWKGATVLLKAAKQFSIFNFQFSNKVLFIFVGGTEKDIKSFKFQVSSFKNIIIVGHRPHQEIPYWLKSADVFVLPNSGKEKISQYYTSPLKMFEYMAVQKPIVASDLPSLREILNENNAILVKPDDPKSLAQGIQEALQNTNFSAKISRQAFEDVQKYTWSKRVTNIIKFINKL